MASRSPIVDRTGLGQKARNLLGRERLLRYGWYRFRWRHFPSWRIVPATPLHVDIELTDACNLRCVMCVHGLRGLPATGFMEPELAHRAIDECAALGVPSVKFNFRGEPMLHAGLLDFVRRAKERGILEVQFNTNGLPANEEKLRALVESGLDRIIFSIDGATPETYERIRVGGDYRRLVRNVETLLRIRKELGRSKPFVRVQMVKSPDTAHEVGQFISMWSSRGVNNIAVIEKQDRSYQDGRLLRDGKPARGRTFCEQPWQRLNINRDGKMLMCCGDWDRKSVVGDFSRDTIRSVWGGDTLRDLRRLIAAGRLDEIPACRTCFRPSTYLWK